jgi:small subunit ribosomal protein S17
VEASAEEEAPAEEAPAEEAPAEEAPAEEPVAEAAADEAEAEPAADEVEAAEPAEAPEAVAEGEAEATAAAPAKRKKKRLPRAQRPVRSKPKREKPAERKPITRLEKPEHERGRSQERQGKVVSAAMDKTIVVRVDTVKVHPRYKKVIRRSSKFHAHDEQNEAKVGDIVLIVETRPLSRMKRWRLRRVVEAAK